jgi:hypothetical protein
MKQLVSVSDPHEVMESVLLKGDLAKLTPEERNSYYKAVCASLGLNPLTKPFEFITLNGKLRLYALKDCTDQLRSLHKISVTDMTETEREGLSVVKTKVQNAEGRTDMAIGAVNIAGLKGEALANALMKAETKSKRRATLSICGLGMLDETEVEDIPASQKSAPAQMRVPSPSEVERDASEQYLGPCLLTPFKNEKFPEWAERFIAAINGAKTEAELDEWDSLNDGLLSTINEKAQAVYKRIDGAMVVKRASFAPKAAPKSGPISSGPQKVPPAPKREGPELFNEERFKWAWEQIKLAQTKEALDAFWDAQIEPDKAEWFPSDMKELIDCFENRQLELQGG